MKLSNFIGRQLSRLKMGLIYFTIGMSTFTTIGVLKMALPKVNFWIIVLFVLSIFLGALILGYILDKSNITVMDSIKTLDMTHRRLSVADYKNNEFRIAMMKVMFKYGEAIRSGEPFDFDDEWDKEYKIFLKKWDPK